MVVLSRKLSRTFVVATTTYALFAVVSTTSNGFQLRTSIVTRPHTTSSSFQTRILTTATTSTKEEVEDTTKLTEYDEAILFGENPNVEPSSTLRMSNNHHRKKDMFGNILPEERRSGANPLDHSTTNPLINKLHTIRQTIQSGPELWYELSLACPTLRAVYDEHMSDRIIDQTFLEFYQSIQHTASVFQNQLGIKKGQHIALFAENSATWLRIDQAIQTLGGVTAVRGADAPLEELRYIYSHSDSANVAILQGPKLLQKLIPTPTTNKNTSPLGFYNTKYGPVKTIILMNREKKTDDEIATLAKQAGVQVYVFHDYIQSQPKTTIASPLAVCTLKDVATIVYTSGTTGNPKGVMLTHGNLLHQIGHRLAPTQPYETSEPIPGETLVSILPVWHITERTFELWMASRGCNIVYSSIPYFKKDLAKHRPQWMVLVPRVLEKIATGVQEKFSSGSAAVKVLSKFFTNVGNAYMKYQKIVRGLVVTPLGSTSTSLTSPVNGMDEIVARIMTFVLKPFHAVGTKLVWSKVQEGFGGRVKVIISGGSALAGSLETFYETAGLNICVGYGLTECSPLISFRRSDANLITAGCAGTACTDTEFRIVDPNVPPSTDQPRSSLPIGEVGLIIAKGPQVMKGYYKNKEATEKAIDAFGWFDTGDLGRVNPATGDLLLTGRAKDTIVLSNGENIEPIPIEDAIIGASPYIDQVMLTGQDGRSLIAITVLNPMELLNGGFINTAQAEEFQKAIEIVSDPKCSTEDGTANSQILIRASADLRKNKALQTMMEEVIKGATNQFRKWEKVNDCYLTLEPFAMSNGQLTQSYKVKRNQVMERYAKELPK